MILHCHAYVILDRIHLSVRVVDTQEDATEELLASSSTLPLSGARELAARDMLAYVGEELLNIAYRR